MPFLGDNNEVYLNPRWHLVNLVPIWILQALLSFLITSLPFLCFMSCGPQNTPTHKAAIGLWILNCATIALEAYGFYMRVLSAYRSLIFQATKTITIMASWVIFRASNYNDPKMTSGEWMIVVGIAFLLALLCLPFSVHLLYAIVWFIVSEGGARTTIEPANEAEVTALNGEDNEHDDPTNIGIGVQDGDPRQWPWKGKLIPNWILQSFFSLPSLGYLKHLRLDMYYHPGIIIAILTYFVIAVLAFSICYQVYFSLQRVGNRLTLKTYMNLQLIKVVALYLLVDLVVLSNGGWRFTPGNWLKSLFAVFVLSILFGSSFIAECVLAIAEYKESLGGMLEPL